MQYRVPEGFNLLNIAGYKMLYRVSDFEVYK